MKDRKTILYLLILSTFLLSMMALLATAESGVYTGAKSSALYNTETKSFLHQHNSNMRLPMASTTKIVTALLAIENLELNKTVRIPKEATGIEGSSLYLTEGDELTALDLVYAVLLQSANDAAVAIALQVSGTVSDFAEKMNERVYEIGAVDTMFQNPHGLDDKNHYTTAHDLALITAEALSNPLFKKICSTYKYSFKIGDNVRTVVNHNKLLKSYKGCIGVKTGYTKKSGRCLVSASERDKVTFIAVTLDDPDDWNDHKDMMNYGFQMMESVNVYDYVSIPKELNTVSIDGAKLPIRLDKSTVVKFKSEEISCYVDLPYYIADDVKRDEIIGRVTVTVGDRQETLNVLADTDLKIKKIKRRFF